MGRFVAGLSAVVVFTQDASLVTSGASSTAGVSSTLLMPDGLTNTAGLVMSSASLAKPVESSLATSEGATSVVG